MDKLTDFKLGMGVAVKAENEWRGVGPESKYPLCSWVTAIQVFCPYDWELYIG